MMKRYATSILYAILAILLFTTLVLSGEYTKTECIKSGGTYEMGVWSQVCKRA